MRILTSFVTSLVSERITC